MNSHSKISRVLMENLWHSNGKKMRGISVKIFCNSDGKFIISMKFPTGISMKIKGFLKMIPEKFQSFHESFHGNSLNKFSFVVKSFLEFLWKFFKNFFFFQV